MAKEKLLFPIIFVSLLIFKAPYSFAYRSINKSQKSIHNPSGVNTDGTNFSASESKSINSTKLIENKEESRDLVRNEVPTITEENIRFAKDIAAIGISAARRELKAKFLELKRIKFKLDYPDQDEEVLLKQEIKDTLNLYVLVSTSMPTSLLKYYLEESIKYDANVVLNGLPDNSWQSLANLVFELNTSDKSLVSFLKEFKQVVFSKSKYETFMIAYGNLIHSFEKEEKLGSIQINENLFKEYKVSNVPAFVLIKEENILSDSKQEFDIISGNIGIKRALEEFASKGSLREKALERLNLSSSNSIWREEK